MTTRGGWAVALMLAAPSCGTTTTDFGDLCPAGTHAQQGLCVQDVPPPVADPTPKECTTRCVPSATNGSGWSEPFLLSVGTNGEPPPPCPKAAGDAHVLGYGDPVWDNYCPTCTCGPPTGSCALPSTMTASDQTCADDGPGATHVPFDPPAAWDGSCSAVNEIPAGSGVASLAIGPLVLTESSCVPSPGPEANKPAPPYWKTTLVSCQGVGYPPCATGGFCMPVRETKGFSTCISQRGVHACPKDGPYVSQLVVYNDVIDNRACGDCHCFPPEGGMCSTMLSVYTDDSCHALQQQSIVSSEPDFCVGITPAGVALGSKSASPPVYTPGTCTPVPWGGNELGWIDGRDPMSVCCML